MSSQIPLDVRSAVARLQKAPRKFASTMPMFPHHYTTDFIPVHEEWWADGHSLSEVASLIDPLRRPRRFLGSRTSWYFDANGFQYWWMYPPDMKPCRPGLINIAPRAYGDREIMVYEQPPWKYERYASYEKQRVQHFGNLELAGKSVLDVGCGSGQMLDFLHKKIDPSRYMGVEPSLAQARQLAEKHPEFAECVVRSTFDELTLTTWRKFDVVACMFGSASYVASKAAVARMRDMLNPGGVLYLMFYDLDFNDGVPQYYSALGFKPTERTRRLSLRSSKEAKGFVTRRWQKPR